MYARDAFGSGLGSVALVEGHREGASTLTVVVFILLLLERVFPMRKGITLNLSFASAISMQGAFGDVGPIMYPGRTLLV